MPWSEGGRSPTLGVSQLATGGAPILDGRRQPSFGGTSRMTRECQVRICERLGVKLPGPTRQARFGGELAGVDGGLSNREHRTVPGALVVGELGGEVASLRNLATIARAEQTSARTHEPVDV